MDDTESQYEKSTPLANLVVGGGLLILAIAPGLLWYLTGNSYWAIGWFIIFILGMAG